MVAAELAVEMKENGLTHAAYTYRRPARNPAAKFYDRKKKIALALAFHAGRQTFSGQCGFQGLSANIDIRAERNCAGTHDLVDAID